MIIKPNNNEKTFSNDILLVTKTDLKGSITYANRAFMNIVDIDEATLIGAPHNIIRHPDMPKIIFKFLWEYLSEGREIHAYVKNLCSDGSYYWVMANVTPSYKRNRTPGGRRIKDVDEDVKMIGYHSARRVPTKEALEVIKPLYEKLLEAERTGGISASEKIISDLLKEKGVNYDEFILSI